MDWLQIDPISAGVAVLALGAALLANRRAKEANQHAEVANRHAADAVGEARSANDLANRANKLSEEANLVVRREAERSTERWHVDWRVQWKEQTAEVLVRNTGSEPALNLTVVVVGEDLHHVTPWEDATPPGLERRLPLPEITQKRLDHVAADNADARERAAGGIFYPPRGFSLPVTVTLVWSTRLGNQHTHQVELDLG